MLYIAVGDNANGANAQIVRNASRQDAAHHFDWRRFRLTIRSSTPLPETIARSGRSACAIRLPSLFRTARKNVHQRRRTERLGRDQRRHRGFKLRLAHLRRILQPAERQLPRSDFCLPERRANVRDHGRRFLQPGDPQFPAQFVGNYFFADFCGGWIRRLDPANGNAVSDFATGFHFRWI